jgi:hypothetical protein
MSRHSCITSARARCQLPTESRRKQLHNHPGEAAAPSPKAQGDLDCHVDFRDQPDSGYSNSEKQSCNFETERHAEDGSQDERRGDEDQGLRKEAKVHRINSSSVQSPAQKVCIFGHFTRHAGKLIQSGPRSLNVASALEPDSTRDKTGNNEAME